MAKRGKAGDKLPGPFEKFTKEFPEVFQGYDAMGKAAHGGGPLDAKTRELVKLGMAIGARLEGATHSHVRKALAAGATPNLTLNPFESIQTMTAYIVQVSLGDTPHGSIAYRSLFAVGMSLFVITLAMNILGHLVVRRYREVY